MALRHEFVGFALVALFFLSMCCAPVGLRYETRRFFKGLTQPEKKLKNPVVQVCHVCRKLELPELEHVTLFCSRLHRGFIGSFARAIFSQDTPMVEIGQWLEPHGLLHQKLFGGHMATAFCYML